MATPSRRRLVPGSPTRRTAVMEPKLELLAEKLAKATCPCFGCALAEQERRALPALEDA